MILAILLLASFLRLFNLGTNPPSLYWEEVALGYDAYSIWKTGNDYHGNPWPIVAFESFGDYKPVGYFYVLAPFVGILGLNEVAVRLPSALAGIITIYLVYLIVLSISRNKSLGLTVAYTLTVMPWHIFISRVGFEVNLGLMWLALSMWLALRAKEKLIYVPAAVLPLIFSMYTYHGLRVIAPLMMGVTGLLFLPVKKIIKSKFFHFAIIMLIVLLMPILTQLNDPIVAQRFNEVNYLAISPAVSQTNALREQYANVWWSRIVFHRYWFWGYEIVRNGLSHFSPAFLFVQGDGNARHQNPAFGLLSWWMLPLIIVSLIKLVDEKHRRLGIYALILLVIAAIPASLSFPTPHTLRTMPSVIGWSIIVGLGGWKLIQLVAPRFRFTLVTVGLLATLYLTGQYWIDLFNNYPSWFSDSWQYGYRQAIEYIRQHSNSDETIYFTRAYGRPSMYMLFFTQADPSFVQTESMGSKRDQSELLTFGQWSFVEDTVADYDWFVSDKPLMKGNYQLQKKIQSPANETVFFIYKS